MSRNAPREATAAHNRSRTMRGQALCLTGWTQKARTICARHLVGEQNHRIVPQSVPADAASGLMQALYLSFRAVFTGTDISMCVPPTGWKVKGLIRHTEQFFARACPASLETGSCCKALRTSQATVSG